MSFIISAKVQIVQNKNCETVAYIPRFISSRRKITARPFISILSIDDMNEKKNQNKNYIKLHFIFFSSS